MIKQRALAASTILLMSLNFGCSTTQNTTSSEPEVEMPVRNNPTHARAMWADSRLYEPAPKLEFEKWLTEKPDTEGKFVILEFWRTWCSACKKGTPFLNEIQKRYPDDVVVIGVNAQSAEKIETYNGPKKNYYLAVDKAQPIAATANTQPVKQSLSDSCIGPDTPAGRLEQGVMEAYFGVWGWPHVVILEPTEHVVVWEGFPAQRGYELTEEIIQKFIAVQKNHK